MLDNPLVSVIIPVYNGSNYLKDAIESVLKQSYKNYEIIVINDGSTDNGETKQIASFYGEKIKYIEKNNGGVASALNLGVKFMQGDYFAWLSHDDMFLPNKIEKQLEAILKSGDETNIAQGNYSFINEKNSFETVTAFHKRYETEKLCDSIFLFLWLEAHFSNLLFHKKHFERVGLFNENLMTAQDNEFMLRLLKGQKTVFVEDAVSIVRLHSESGTTKKQALLKKENCDFYLNMAENISKNEAKKIFNNASIFYCKIASIIKSMEGKKEIEKIEKKFLDSISINENKEIEFKKKYGKPLVIFGAGQYGIRLNYELTARDVFPLYFIDNDRKKKGKVIAGIKCYPVEYIKENLNVSIIIAQKAYTEAYNQLKNIGAERIILKEEIDAELLKIQPSRIPTI